MRFRRVSHGLPEVDELFQLTRKRVTKQHIIDYSPGDPGYPNYVRLWTAILKSGRLPKQSEFDLSEVIGLTGWWTEQSDGFRAYRRFTSSVAVALILSGNASGDVRAANYLARDLLIDTDIGDTPHFEAVRAVLPVVRQALIDTGYEEDYPFYTLASLIMSQIAKEFDAFPELAQQLLDDDHAVRQSEKLTIHVWSPDLVLGLTGYNQLHKDWVQLASMLTNPIGDENMQLIIDEFVKMKEKYPAGKQGKS